jgi:hypothetical protein
MHGLLCAISDDTAAVLSALVVGEDPIGFELIVFGPLIQFSIYHPQS